MAETKSQVLTNVLFCTLVLLLSKVTFSKPADVLSTLDKNHPRLMLKNQYLQELKARYPKDKTLQRYIADVLVRADMCMLKDTLVYKKQGIRLLKVSRECVARVYALGLAYRWTGNEKYAQKATEELLAVCDFNDWNPSHFLDTAEMSHAVAIGYDWLYHYFDDQTRQKIKKGLIENGLEAGIRAYGGSGIIPGNKDLVAGWWTGSAFNWNIVCNNGLLIGALAVAETDPDYARRIIPYALASMPKALASYAPEGAWMEGPSYWHYATRYTAYGISALDSALGTDFGLSKFQGLSQTGLFAVHMTSPTGMIFSFADSAGKEHRLPMPCMFWLAKKFNNQFIADSEHAELAKYAHCPRYAVEEEYTASPQHIIWYMPPSSRSHFPKKLDRYFHSPVEIAFFRSAWNNPDALFAAVKAGYNQVDHGHLDLGSFELDALGVRWVLDLGKDDYDLPGYWRRGKNEPRWSYYRLRSESHNVPIMNNRNQNEFAETKVLKFNSEKSSASVVIDLTTAYSEFAEKVTRGLAMIRNRRAVIVQDEFEIQNPCDLAWGITTDAEITVQQGGIAELALDGKKLVVKILAPANAEFLVELAKQKPPEESNTGVRRLVLRLPQTDGNVRIAVLLSPVWKNGFVKTAELRPLAEW